MDALSSRAESDGQLMARVQANDSAAFAELYDRHATHAFAVAQSVCHDASLSEEAVQEGFLSIWRGRASYEPRPNSSFRGWAMQTVRNRAIDARRHVRTGKYPPTTELPATGLPEAVTSTTHEDLIKRGKRRELGNLLQRLPEAQAEVITLAYFGEMTHAEIADQLRLPSGTVKGRMRLGLEKLRRAMEAAL